MKIETLEEFVIFSKHLSFTKAAEELFMSQPSLSMHMSSLEKEIGFNLIERSNRPRLTAAGQVFLEHCQNLLEIYHQALVEGQLAASSTPPARILDHKKSFELHLLASMVKGVPYQLVNADENLALYDAIEKDVVDMGLGLDYSHIDALQASAEQRGLDSFPVGIARLGICMMKSHPLAKKASLSKTDLYEYAIGIGSGTYFEEWQAILNSVIQPAVPLRYRLDPLGGLAHYTSFDFGNLMHFYILDALRSLMRNREDVVIFDTLDGEPLETTSVIIYNAKSANPNVQEYVKRLKEVVSSPSYPALPHTPTD